jgi:RNA polymerase sigma factor (sigma-70 family)
MSTEESVTDWLHTLSNLSQSQTPYQRAASALYHRYIDRLIGLARKKLSSSRRRASDEEDVAHAALEDLFQGIRHGRFARLDDKQDLWQLLVMLTERRAIDQIRRETGRKRGSGRIRGESAFALSDDSGSAAPGIDQVKSPEPTPEFAAELLEELKMRLKQLNEVTQLQPRIDPESLRKIVIMRLQRFTNQEIAQELRCVERTVNRRMEIIRQIWRSAHE